MPSSKAIADAYILVRQSQKVVESELRFVSRPVSGPNARTKCDEWRTVLNKAASPDTLRKYGKVASVPFTEELAEEYAVFRADYKQWKPAAKPPAGLREERLVPQDNTVSDGSEEDDADDDDAGDVDVSDHTASARQRSKRNVRSLPMPNTAEGGYIRQPALFDRRVAFICEGDIWMAELTPGLEARLLLLDGDEAAPTDDERRSDDVRCYRLSNGGGCSHPAFSPDGTLLAFTSSAGLQGGTAEVFVCDARGAW